MNNPREEFRKKLMKENNARFVRENFGDRTLVKPNESFIKEWTFRNNGETEWPIDSLFI